MFVPTLIQKLHDLSVTKCFDRHQIALMLTVLLLIMVARLRMIRSESPETLYTMTTQQTKPPGAVVLETR